MKNQTKTKIGVGYVVKAKVGELENTTREVRSRRVMKEVVGCVQAVLVLKKFPVHFENSQKKERVSSLFLFLSSKEEVDMDESLSHYPEKEQS